ncbi:unnamed protein product, partial [Closterium sp. NIES-54]
NTVGTALPTLVAAFTLRQTRVFVRVNYLDARAPQIVSACIVLHNMALYLGSHPRLREPRERSTWGRGRAAGRLRTIGDATIASSPADNAETGVGDATSTKDGWSHRRGRGHSLMHGGCSAFILESRL